MQRIAKWGHYTRFVMHDSSSGCQLIACQERRFPLTFGLYTVQADQSELASGLLISCTALRCCIVWLTSKSIGPLPSQLGPHPCQTGKQVIKLSLGGFAATTASACVGGEVMGSKTGSCIDPASKLLCSGTLTISIQVAMNLDGNSRSCQFAAESCGLCCSLYMAAMTHDSLWHCAWFTQILGIRHIAVK